MITRGILNMHERKSSWWKSKNEKMPTKMKPSNSRKCKICSMKTYQKDSICVLCKTGIKKHYEELEKLLKIQV